MEQAVKFVSFGVDKSIALWIFDESELAVDALADRDWSWLSKHEPCHVP